RNCSSDMPTTYASIRSVASRMSSKRALESRGILDLRQDARFQPRLESVRNHQINSAAKRRFEQLFRVHVGVERLVFKFDQKVQIAGVRQFAAHRRSEEPQSPNAETTQAVSVTFECRED